MFLAAVMSDETIFQPLQAYLSKIPAIAGKISCGFSNDGCWWAKFQIDIEHPLAWNVVQELGYVLNYLSLEERLPTEFKPVSHRLIERRPARLPVVGYRMQKQAFQTRDMRPMVGGSSTASSERGTTVEGGG